MHIINVVQGTPEWKSARAGIVTASRINDVMAKIKTGEAAARRDYRSQIVAEILTGTPQDPDYEDAVMIWGKEQEPNARSAYELAQGVMVQQVGLVLHPTLDRTGASPDGLLDDEGMGCLANGGLEIKCPKTATHLKYLLENRIPKEYENQMLWQMACCERAWCDFVSFDPRLPENMQLFVKRFSRSEARILEIEEEVKLFLSEVDAMIRLFKSRGR